MVTMASVDRWRRAQEAEIDHHKTSFWSKENISTAFDLYFDRDVGRFDERRVLEVGSGTGMIHNMDGPALAVGIDPLTSSVSDQLEGSSAELFTGVGERLPFESGYFDDIIHYNVIDHTSRPTQVLEEIHRVLSGNGHLFLGVNTFEIPRPLRKLLDLIDPPHPHHFSSGEMEGLVQNAGFKIESIQSVSRRNNMGPLNLKKFAGLVCQIRWTTILAKKD